MCHTPKNFRDCARRKCLEKYFKICHIFWNKKTQIVNMANFDYLVSLDIFVEHPDIVRSDAIAFFKKG